MPLWILVKNKELSPLDLNTPQWQDWARLMEKVQQGDMDAYGLLLSEISPLLFSYVRRRVFNPQQVEDVYQEVLMTFHKARHTYQPDRPFGPWFFAVARNAIFTALGKNRKFVEKEIAFEFLPETETAVPEEGLEDDLYHALRALPKTNRQAVEMLKLRGMDLESAARAVGISKVALKVRAHRGYVMLRKILVDRK